MKKPVIPESFVVNSCMKWLWAHGCDVIRNNTGAFKKTYGRKDGSIGESWIRTGKNGSGDILACSPKGRWLEIECKSSIGKQNDYQKLREIEISNRNGIYIVARSIDDLEARKSEIVA